LGKLDAIRIANLAPVMRASGNLIELKEIGVSFPPAGPRGGPVFNFRSEGRHFENSNRCLIPASALFEITGKKSPKVKHRFTLPSKYSEIYVGNGAGRRRASFGACAGIADIQIGEIRYLLVFPQSSRRLCSGSVASIVYRFESCRAPHLRNGH